MTFNVSGLGAATPGGFRPAEATGAGAVKGEWNGLAVTLSDDPASLLADAAEEMSFAASERVEKDVSERKKPEKERRLTVVIPPSEAVQDMRERLAGRLNKLLSEVKEAMGNPDAFRRAVESFSDPAERHAALAWLEEQLADEPSLASLAAREREKLESEAAVEIQAGYNLEGVDAGAVGGPDAGRDCYRRTILGHGDVSAMLESIINRSGEMDFAETADFLRRAVGADLSAANSSIDKRELESMNNDLYQLRALANFTREFDADIAKLRDAGGKPPLSLAGVNVLKLFCKAKNERLVMLDSLKGVLGLEGGKDAVYDVRALTLAHNLAHQLPAKLFQDEEARQRLLAAGQKMLDAAIELEDSLAEEG